MNANNKVEFFTDGASSKHTNAGYSCIYVKNGRNIIYYGNLPKEEIKDVQINDGSFEVICNVNTMKPTNNRAELMGILIAAKIIASEKIIGANIISDSSYCVNTFNTWLQSWKESIITLQSKANLDLVLKIDSLLENTQTTFIHQYGHVNPDQSYYAKMNTLADKYAVAGKSLEYKQTNILAIN
jgi:ribonuclease HI